jgi:hypothetical protein
LARSTGKYYELFLDPGDVGRSGDIPEYLKEAESRPGGGRRRRSAWCGMQYFRAGTRKERV